MPTDYVDMGYYNGIFQGYSDGVESFDLPTFDAFIADLRDRVKTKMEAENGGQNWQVSRIIRWTGLNSNYYQYAFKVRRLVSGTPDGREWFFSFAGPNLSLQDRYPEGNEVFDSSEVGSLFRWTQGSAGNDGIFVIQYHKGALDIAAYADLSYTGQPTDGEQVEIGGKTYTFQTTLTDSDGNVQIGATADDSFNNLAAAIDLSGTAGTDYAASTTAHPSVDASNDTTNDVMTATAETPGDAGNSITVSTTVANASWDTELYGGTLRSGNDAKTWDFDATPEDAWNGTSPDFAPPNTSPWTNLPGFLPSTTVNRPVLPGWAKGNFSPREASCNCILFNHEIPFMAWYHAVDDRRYISSVHIMGDIIIPRRDNDRWNIGNLAFNLDMGNNTFQNNNWADAARPDGTVDTYDTPEGHAEFFWDNQPRADGTYDKDPIKIVNNINDKGFFHKEIYAVQGRNDDQIYTLFDSVQGRMLALDNIVIPWVTNAPIPFMGWPVDPQKHPLDLT